MRRSRSPISACPSLSASASARIERIVSANSECGPLNEYTKPSPSGSPVQRAACTAPDTLSASS